MSCKCDNLQIVALKGDKGDTGAPGPQGPIGATGVILVTRVALSALKTASTLVAGQFYQITDWSTIEQLIVMAVATNKLSEEAHSNTFEQDIISVDLSNANQANWKITYRKDIVKDLSAYYDWRTVKFTRWETVVGNGIYAKTTVTVGSIAREFFTFANDINFSTPLTSFIPATDGNGGDNTSMELGNRVTNTIFGNNTRSSKIRLGDGNIFSLDSAKNNTIGNGFKNNIIGMRLNECIIKNDCTFNIIEQSCDSNTIGANFTQNKISSIGFNTIGDGFARNTIEKGFSFNTLVGNDVTDNQFLEGVAFCTIPSGFRKYITNTVLFFIDFTPTVPPAPTQGSLVALDHTKEIFKNSALVNRLRFVDGADVIQYRTPNF